ncbi:hypothetical protein ACFL6X_00025 [Candidatus Latescibacterota bacterium]
MDLPRPNMLRRELSSMGIVYLVVLALLVLALVVGLMPDRPPATPAQIRTEVPGSPPAGE